MGKTSTLDTTFYEIVVAFAGRLRVMALRLSQDTPDPGPLTPENIDHLERLSVMASRLGRLMRDLRALEGDATDEARRLLNQALDELRADVGWDV